MKYWKLTTIAAAAVLITTLLFLVLRKDGTLQRLPDGSVLRLGQVKYGRQNTFYMGDSWQQTVARFLPTKGINAFGIKLMPIDKVSPFHGPGESLDFLVHLIGVTNRNTVNADWQNNVRVFLRGDDSQEYEIYAPHFYASGNRTNAVVGLAQASVFPRESRVVHVRMARKMEGRWQNFAQFSFKNPARQKLRDWEGEALPNTKQVGDLILTLKEIEVLPQVMPHNNQTTLTAKCPFRLSHRGEDFTQWMIERIVLRDSSGNFDDATMTTYTGRIFQGKPGDWQDYTVYRVANPKSVWKLEVEFSAMMSNDMLTVVLPLPPPNYIRTNFNGIMAGVAVRQK